MKAVILCGGRGTRLREETERKPKPLVEIGGKPILWHIMKIYSSYGIKEFILCLGYKGNMIKEYFLNYRPMNSDFTLKLDGKSKITFYNEKPDTDWAVTLVDTGDDVQTGARIKKIEKYITENEFLLTYGDGVGNIDIHKLIKFHRSHGKIGTITGVHPSSRFGELRIKNKKVVEFNEKPQVTEGYINGGFFLFNKKIFDYLDLSDGCYLERKPLEQLTRDNQLMVYSHDGFWQCVDTYRELELLNNLWKLGQPPWKVW